MPRKRMHTNDEPYVDPRTNEAVPITGRDLGGSDDTEEAPAEPEEAPADPKDAPAKTEDAPASRRASSRAKDEDKA